MTVIAPVIIPASVAGMIWLIAGQLWKRPATPSLAWGGSLAVAVSFGAGHWALVGLPPFPPVTAIHTLVFAGLAVGLVGIAESYWQTRWWLSWPLRGVLAGTAAWWQFKTLAEHAWSTPETIGWLTAVTLTVCLAWASLDSYAKRNQGLATPIFIWLFACATSVGLVFGASAMLGQLAGSLAAICGAAIVLALWSGRFPLDRGAAGAFAFILIGLLWQGYFYAELPLASTGLLIVALINAGAVNLVFPAKTRILDRSAAVFASLLVTASIALAVAYRAYRATALELGDYTY